MAKRRNAIVICTVSTEEKPALARSAGSDELILYTNQYFVFFFFFNDTATTEIYTGWYTLSLHDALPICATSRCPPALNPPCPSPNSNATPGSSCSQSTLPSRLRSIMAFARPCPAVTAVSRNFNRPAPDSFIHHLPPPSCQVVCRSSRPSSSMSYAR